MTTRAHRRGRADLASLGWARAVALTCVLAAAGGAGPALAQQVGRIQYESYALPNGLRVVLSEDHSTPIVTVDVWYHVGSADERLRRSGFAHLFEHMMFQGSAHVRKAEHFQLVERAGGEVNGSTNEDRTNYFETLPSNRLNLGLWLEADRMRSLSITQENFEIQRSTVKEERRLGVDNQPYARAVLEGMTQPFDSAGCLAYAHTVIGSMADLDSARVEDVQAFFHQYYAPNNAVLTVSGDFVPAVARRLIQQYFGDIPRTDTPAPVRCDVAFSRGARTIATVDSNANLPAVALVFAVPDRDHADAPAIELLASILTDGESSRLNRKLVREERVAVGAAGFNNLHTTAGVALFYAIANQGVEPSRLEQLLSAEIERVVSDTVPQAELTKAQNQFRAGAVRTRQTTLGVAEALQEALRFHGDLEVANTEVQRYLSVTTADLRRVAQRYFVPANRLTIVVNTPSGGGN